jgi:serine protease Do
VTPDGPAAKAGIQVGDVITTFDSKEVPEMRRLPLMVAETEVDKVVDVTVFRKGQGVTLKVKVGEMQIKDETADKDQENGADKQPASNAEKVEDLGFSAAPLTDALRLKYEIGKDVKGIVVTTVTADGVAAEQGIIVGDVISEAGQQDIKAPKDLIEQVKAAKKDNRPLLLLVNRKDDLRFVAITFGKKK